MKEKERKKTMKDNVTIFDHPLIQHKLSFLRSKDTGSKLFRELVSEISMLMCYEATRDLPLQDIEVETPVATTKTKVLAGRKMAFVPILRAGTWLLPIWPSEDPEASSCHSLSGQLPEFRLHIRQ